MDSNKNKDIFKNIYEKEVDRIFRFVFLRISSREDAVDITEDVFYKFWQSIQKGEEIDNPTAFLFAITRNKIIDWYRKKKAVSLDSLMDSDSGEDRPLDILDPDSHKDILISSEAGEIIRSFKTLSDTDARIMELRFIEGLPPQEIAKMLDLSANSVSIRITRTIQKLRTELKIEVENNE